MAAEKHDRSVNCWIQPPKQRTTKNPDTKENVLIMFPFYSLLIRTESEKFALPLPQTKWQKTSTMPTLLQQGEIRRTYS